jgi:hypothetical protein
MRATGFNKPQFSELFSKLEKVMEKHTFAPSVIFNADKMKASYVQANSKVLLCGKTSE